MKGIGMTAKHFELAQELAQWYAGFSDVQAVALGGSVAGGSGDAKSDIDLYVFTAQPPPLSARQALASERRSPRADMNLNFWDLGDEWFDGVTGIEVDVMFWDPAWIEGQLERVWTQHQASLGYSTCFWHTIRQASLLFDRHGWFAALQQKSRQPYPEALRRAIIDRNHAVLRGVIPAYAHQIQKAVQRGDLVSMNHRLAALLASYFDVVIAANWLLHPGEKRLLAWTQANCPRLPEGMADQVNAALQAAGDLDGGVGEAVEKLLDSLDVFLAACD